MSVKQKEPPMAWDYAAFLSQNNAADEAAVPLPYEPLISVVVPVYNMEDRYLSDCIDSVLRQSYQKLELILVDDCSSWENVRPLLLSYEKKDPRVRLHFREENGHISRTTNDGIFMSSGEFIAFMDCDDVIEPNALYEFVKVLNENPETDFIYSDEDKISDSGQTRHNPFFKPDWSPDLFMELMYTNHLGMYRASIVKEIGGLRTEFDGSQDYDMTMRFMEKSDNKRVAHVPKVLYQWREREGSTAADIEEKPYVFEAQRKLKEEALLRRGIKGKIVLDKKLTQYHVVYEATEEPLISIVIPSKDHPEVIAVCLSSLYGKTAYRNFEVIVVDNGSNETNKQEMEALLSKYPRTTYLYRPMDFNFSAMCNIGAKEAKGEYILLLNDDIEIIHEDWLSLLIGQAILPHVGAVGAKLLYPNTTLIQHSGVANLTVGPGHLLLRWDDNNIAYFARNLLTYDYLAVTAACLLVKAEKYREVGGLDESFAVAYNDIDFCFRLYEAGYYNVQRNDAVLYHHESLSRGSDAVSPEKHRRQMAEMERLYQRHPALRGKDPFFNPNFAGNNPYFGIGVSWDRLAEEGCYIEADGRRPVAIKRKAVNIDTVDTGRHVRVFGWSAFGNEAWDTEAKKECFIELCPGVRLVANTFILPREDAQNLTGAATDQLGFTALFHQKYFDGSKNDYVIGVKYTLHGKTRYVAGARAARIHEEKIEPSFFPVSEEKTTSYLKEGFDGEADAFCLYEDAFGIAHVHTEGWAILRDGPKANILPSRRLLYRTKEQGSFELPLRAVLRNDHLQNAPEIRGLLRAGFRADQPLLTGEIKQEALPKEGTWSLVTEDLTTGKIRVKKLGTSKVGALTGEVYFERGFDDAETTTPAAVMSAGGSSTDEPNTPGAQTAAQVSLIIIGAASSSSPRDFSGKKDAMIASLERQHTYPGEIIRSDGYLYEDVSRASGEIILFLRDGDVLSDDAIAKTVSAYEHGLTYSDAGFLSSKDEPLNGRYYMPDFAPDTLLSSGYMAGLIAADQELVLQAVKDMDKAPLPELALYELTLRLTELLSPKEIHHLRDILYYRRSDHPEMTAQRLFTDGTEPLRAEIAKASLTRRGIAAQIRMDAGYVIPVYELTSTPLVSVIIPSKDHFDILSTCLTTLWKKTAYPHYEVIVVDNGSNDENQKKIRELLDTHDDTTYLYEKMEFNFSKMCNMGAAAAKGEYLLFLNDDIEIIGADWMTVMLGQAMQPRTGAVGAKLYYPDSNLIQHIGVVNLFFGPTHAFLRQPDDRDWYFGKNRCIQNFVSETGACLLVSKEKYEEAGRMDEALPVAYNDVDLCFGLYEKGYYNVTRNDAVLFHHESLSRKEDNTELPKMIKIFRDRRYMMAKHPALSFTDPFYNPHLSDEGIMFGERHDPVRTSNTFYSILSEEDLKTVFPEDQEVPKLSATLDPLEKGEDLLITGRRSLLPFEGAEQGRLHVLFQGADQKIIEIPTERYELDEPAAGNEKEQGFVVVTDKDLLQGTYRYGFMVTFHEWMIFTWKGEITVA